MNMENSMFGVIVLMLIMVLALLFYVIKEGNEHAAIFKQECAAIEGKAVWDGRQYTCLK